MAEQVGPRGGKPAWLPVLRGLQGDEGFPGEFHQGQQASSLHHRPDIRLQPDLNANIKCCLLNGRLPYKDGMKENMKMQRRKFLRTVTIGGMATAATLTSMSPSKAFSRVTLTPENETGSGVVTVPNVTGKIAIANVINVTEYGAVGDGVTDDTAAIQATIAAALSLAKAGQTGIMGSGGVYVGTVPTVFFPSGVYKITGSLTADTVQSTNYMLFKGENAILVASAGVTIFGGIGYNNRFEGLIFRDGAVGVSLKTNNVDTTVVVIENCEFHNQTTACISSDSNSNSTILNVTNCKFNMPAGYGGYIGKFESGDEKNFHNCWITAYSQIAFLNNGLLVLNDCIGVPGEDLVAAGGRWIDNYGSVTVNNFRFGGESGGGVLVRNYAELDKAYPITSNKVSIVNCPAYDNGYLVEFYKFPNFFEFSSNYGLVDSDGFYFDSSLTDSDYRDFQYYGKAFINRNYYNGLEYIYATIPANRLGHAILDVVRYKSGNSVIQAIDRLREDMIVGSGGMGGGWSNSANNITTVTTTNKYGVQVWKKTCKASTGYFVNWRSTFLDPIALTYKRIYTLIFQVEATILTDKTKEIILEIGSFRHTFFLTEGNNILVVPFVYLNNTGVANSDFDEFRLAMYSMENTDEVIIGRHILLEGFYRYEKEIIELAEAATPTGYTVGTTYDTGYYKGDISWKPNVAAGGSVGEVCTTSGNPGTWKSFGTIAS